MKTKYLIYFILVLILSPLHAESKLYQYVDENGVKHFTEDKGLIPDHSQKSTVEYTDKYDYMSDEEKKAAKQKELIEAEKLKARRQAELRVYRQKALLEEQLQAKKERLMKTRTKVNISNNQILIPVTLNYENNIITTTLLLDTGATSTLIHDSVAAKLKVNGGEKSLARVAGGGLIETKEIKLNSIKVGPKELKSITITVVEHEGTAESHNGLLGLDFLSSFQHTIDYEGQYINWTE